MSSGVTTPNLETANIVDTVLANRDGNSVQQPVGSLAQQLGSSGPIADKLAAFDARIADTETESQIYDDTAAGLAATSEGAQFRVTSSSPDVAYEVYKHGAGGVATFITDTPRGSALAPKLDRTAILAPTSLYDPATMVRTGYYWSGGNNRIQAQAGYKVTKRIPVTPGEVIYIADALRGGTTVLGFSATDVDVPVAYVSQLLECGFGLVTVPAGMHFLQVNLYTGGLDYSATTFIARSPVPLAPSVPRDMIRHDRLERETPVDFMMRGPNLFDPAMVMAGAVLMAGGTVATSSVGRLSGFIPVEPGAQYRISGVSAANSLAATAFAAPDGRSTGSYLGSFAPLVDS